MYRPYTKRLRELCARLEDGIKEVPGMAKGSCLQDAVRVLDEKPVLMLRFPGREARDLVEVPCAGSFG